MAIVKRARRHYDARVWYDQHPNTRSYNVFGLEHVVCGTGESYWRLIVGQWLIAFAYRDKRAENANKRRGDGHAD